MAFDKKKRAAELAAMSNKELIALGAKGGLKLSDKAAKRQMISAILEAENKKYLEGAGAATANTAAKLDAALGGAALHAGDLTPPDKGIVSEAGKDAETSEPATLPGWMLPFHSRLASLESGLKDAHTRVNQLGLLVDAQRKSLKEAGVEVKAECTSLYGKVSDLRKK